jgi:ArsR family transcriptional regulator
MTDLTSTLTATPTTDLKKVSSNTERLALKLKACGDALRLQILQVLKYDTFGVLELTQIFETKQSGMSHHLKVINTAGLVEAQREGNAIFYRRCFTLNDELEQQCNNHVFAMVDALPLPQSVDAGIETIRAQRARQSQAFFERNASRFAEQAELISDHEQYAKASFDLVRQALPNPDHCVLELGPGEGRFLKPLAIHYDQVIGVDTSESMLKTARQYCVSEGLDNVELLLGDSRQFALLDVPIDAVVMNMVLHHVPAPAEIFKDTSNLLNTGGILVVCDLSHHNQDWTKQNCGDLWLGFESQELVSWAERAHLLLDESVFVGLRNGFQIQLHRFVKTDKAIQIAVNT